MSKGRLSNGFDFTIEEEAYDNWELLEVLQQIDDGKEVLIVKAFPMLIGDAQFNALKAHIRNTEGKVSVSMMVQCFTEIMEQIKQLKKS